MNEGKPLLLGAALEVLLLVLWIFIQPAIPMPPADDLPAMHRRPRRHGSMTHALKGHCFHRRH